MRIFNRINILLVLSFLASGPLSSQWERIYGPYFKPVSSYFDIFTDTAGKQTLISSMNIGTFLTTDYGATWHKPSGAFSWWNSRNFVRIDSCLFVGTEHGMFRSRDNGQSWTVMGSGYFDDDRFVIFAKGTDLFAFPSRQDSLYISTDDGESWSVGYPGLSNFHYYYYSPKISSLEVVDSVILATADDGIFRSTDNGASWDSVSPIYFMNVPPLCIYPDGMGGTYIFAGSQGKGIARSTDAGLTWMIVTSGMGDISVDKIWSIPTAEGGRKLYARGSYLLTSTDNGSSWTVSPAGTVPDIAVVSEMDGDTVLLAGPPAPTGGILRSTDFGSTWAPVDNSLNYSVSGNLFTAPNGSGGKNLFITSGGFVNYYPYYNDYWSAKLFRSTDEGTTWTQTLDTTGISWFSYSPGLQEGAFLYAKLYSGNSLFVSSDYGASWTNHGSWVSSLPCVVVPNGSSGDEIITLVGTYSNYSIYQSLDHGISWSKMAATWKEKHIWGFTEGSDGNGGTNILAIGNYEVYSSSDYGSTWVQHDSGIAANENPPPWGISNLDPITAIPNGTGGTTFFAVGRRKNGDQYVLSTDNGASWATIPINNLFPVAVGSYTDGSMHSTLFAAGEQGNVLISQNNGAGWVDIGKGWDNAGVTSFAASSQYLYVSTSDTGGWRWPLDELQYFKSINLTAIGGVNGSGGSESSPALSSRMNSVRRINILSKHTASGTRKTLSGTSKILLDWTKDHHQSFVRYHIYVDTVPNATMLLDSTQYGADDTVRIIEGLGTTTKYYFRVTAVDISGAENNYSNKVTAVTRIFSPKPLLAVIPGNGRAEVHWSRDVYPDFIRYILYCDTSPASTSVIDSAILSPSDTSRIIYGLTNGTIYYFRIATVDSMMLECDSTSTVPVIPNLFSFTMDPGWNMVSVPGEMSDYRTTALFPFAVSTAYFYEDGYTAKDILANGTGYWVRFNNNRYITMGGTECRSETVAVHEGWNMIGSVSFPIAVASIASEQEGIVTSQYFGFSKGYMTSDSIQPGKGYWVKVNQDGMLILSAPEGGLAKSMAGHLVRIVPTTDQPPPPPDGGSVIKKQPLPTTFALQQNYPNPFNPTTTIAFELPTNSHVSLKIYNLLGQVVATFENKTENAGYKRVEWNASNFASGVYFYRIDAVRVSEPGKAFTNVKKMVLIK